MSGSFYITLRFISDKKLQDVDFTLFLELALTYCFSIPSCRVFGNKVVRGWLEIFALDHRSTWLVLRGLGLLG